MVQPWADQPFALIPTSKVTKPNASAEMTLISDNSMLTVSRPLDISNWAIPVANAHNMLIRCLNSFYLQAPYVKEEADIQDLVQYSLHW
jgi:hypothetical protein